MCFKKSINFIHKPTVFVVASETVSLVIVLLLAYFPHETGSLKEYALRGFENKFSLTSYAYVLCMK